MKWIHHVPWADPSSAPRENQTVLALTGMEEAPDIEVLDYDADTAKHIKWWMPIPEFPGKTRCDFDIQGDTMPLNKKGMKIKAAMQKYYGKEKGKAVFYASENKGNLKGVTKKK